MPVPVEDDHGGFRGSRLELCVAGDVDAVGLLWCRDIERNPGEVGVMVDVGRIREFPTAEFVDRSEESQAAGSRREFPESFGGSRAIVGDDWSYADRCLVTKVDIDRPCGDERIGLSYVRAIGATYNRIIRK